MKLVGMCCARNEEWCIGVSLRVMLMFCDSVVVLVHASTDRTLEIVQEISSENKGRVIVGTDDNPVWAEMEHREKMLQVARADGATHLWIGDCDEIISANLLDYDVRPDGTLSNIIHRAVENLKPREMLTLPGYNLRGSLDKFHSNGIWGNRWFSTAFMDDSKAHYGGDKFHSREPAGVNWMQSAPIMQRVGGIVHLWGLNERRQRAHHANYKVHEALRWPNKPIADIERMYNWWRSPADCGESQPWTYATVPDAWLAPYAPLMKYLHPEDEPWEEQAVRNAVAEHGAERFRGLDLFGVA